MSRKNLFADIPLTPAANAASPLARPLQGSTGPMSAVKRSVNDLKERTRRADEIEKSLADGQSVIEIDPSVIDPSFVQDRMDGEIDGLRESIREQGQQVPILVRLHPTEEGRYQVAFGHRRLRALKDIGIKAKAIVRELTDEQLVIAQGQENNEREDLSFIEKARFAARLKDRFSRDVIMSSLSIDRTTLSTMLQILDGLSDALIDAIGPAPGIGRPSWQKMSDFMAEASDPEGVVKYATSPDVQRMPSADRFKAVLTMRAKKPSRALPQVMSMTTGARLAQISQNKVKLDISIDKRATPEFAEFVLNQLPALFEAHLAAQHEKKEA